MNATSAHPATLLFTDIPEIERQLQPLIESIYLPLLTIRDPAIGLELFESHRATIMLFAFSTPNGAERMLLDLYRNSRKVAEIAHQSMLLCNNTETHTAYSLCRRGLFDDYLVVRPLYDPHAINMALMRAKALLSGTTGDAAVRLGAVPAALTECTRELHRVVDDREQIETQTAASFEQLGASLRARYQKLTEIRDKCRIEPDSGLDQELEQARSCIDATVQQWGHALEEQVEKLDELGRTAKVATSNILLIEDSPFDAELVAAILHGAGYQLQIATTAADAMILLEKCNPDLLLLDYELPDQNGLQLLQQIRSDTRWSELPVVMLTGESSREIVGESIKQGVNDYVIKPAQRELLLEKVEQRLLRGSNQDKANR